MWFLPVMHALQYLRSYTTSIGIVIEYCFYFQGDKIDFHICNVYDKMKQYVLCIDMIIQSAVDADVSFNKSTCCQLIRLAAPDIIDSRPDTWPIASSLHRAHAVTLSSLSCCWLSSILGCNCLDSRCFCDQDEHNATDWVPIAHNCQALEHKIQIVVFHAVPRSSPEKLSPKSGDDT